MNVTLDLRDYSVEFREDLAFETEDPEILAILMNDEYARVRKAVAESEFVTVDILEKIVGNELRSIYTFSEDTEILIAAIKNDKCTKKLFWAIIDEEYVNWEVLEAIAEDNKVTTQMLDTLSKSLDDAVRYAVARNKKTSYLTLKKLSNDSRKSIAKAAMSTLQTKK